MTDEEINALAAPKEGEWMNCLRRIVFRQSALNEAARLLRAWQDEMIHEEANAKAVRVWLKLYDNTTDAL
jgi:hypothetical protein